MKVEKQIIVKIPATQFKKKILLAMHLWIKISNTLKKIKFGL